MTSLIRRVFSFVLLDCFPHVLVRHGYNAVFVRMISGIYEGFLAQSGRLNVRKRLFRLVGWGHFFFLLLEIAFFSLSTLGHLHLLCLLGAGNPKLIGQVNLLGLLALRFAP